MNKSEVITHSSMLAVLRLALWKQGNPVANEAVFHEMQQHRIVGLAAPVLPELSIQPDLFARWEKEAVCTVSKFYRYQRQQDSLVLSVPFAILKGTAAAQYYPYPEYRTMGDIDIMTRREDYETACSMLMADGYTDITDPANIRHRELIKNNILVEVHRYFAQLEDPDQARYLDDLIIDNINETHVLPDLINGLVLLEHISQHLENGLGLRQIIDWMMFVDKCLPDEKWVEFREMARKTGLETLAIVTTRMCEMYLGLHEREWCAGADSALCEQLMDYVLACGNFGIKIHDDEHLDHAKTLSRMQSVLSTFSVLQERGLINWKAAQNHEVLKPFAWLYQVGKYLKMGMTQAHFFSQLNGEWALAQQQKALFDALGVRRENKGVAVYQDGEYRKK